ncbi:MAG: hypothetical protein J6Y37_13560 [Paludibacteraceae bacterium]|nr:hypothetical protein [Paludibacteraceae bacterium]
MHKLPKHIIDAIRKSMTSLGEHPAYPPEEEEKFVLKIVQKTFSGLSERFGDVNVDELKAKLSSLLARCRKIESHNKDALEKLCVKAVNRVMQIPEDTLSINVKLVDTVDVSNERKLPEPTDDYTFDDLSDMSSLGDEVYKRRMLDALVTGAAMSYASDVSLYLDDLFSIDPDLPSMYAKINAMNTFLLYTERDTFVDGKDTDAGKVDVAIGSPDIMPEINSEGVIFPVLLEETFKGIFELAISHGLPERRERAEYVVKKSDFRLAEVWDMRLGLPLWGRIAELIPDNVEPNFLLMAISMLPVDEFNDTLANIFAHTKRGVAEIDRMCDEITDSKERDDFDDYMRTQYGNTRIDDGYYTSEELLTDCVDDY